MRVRYGLALALATLTLLHIGCDPAKKLQRPNTATVAPVPPEVPQHDTPIAADADTADALIEVDGMKVVDQEPVWLPKPAPFQPTRTLTHDLLHVKLQARFDWAKRQLQGKVNLTLRPHFYPSQTLELDAKGMLVHRVAKVAGAQLQDVKYTYTDGLKLNITLDKAYTRAEKYELYIEYTARPDSVKQGGSEAINDAKGLYFINADGKESGKPQQIWTQGETESTSCWVPVIDSPNQRTTQEMLLTVADSFTTLSNGVLLRQTKNADGSRTDHWKMEKPHAPYLFMMAVGRFTVTRDTWRGIPVEYYLEPAYKPYARTIFGDTPAMLELFSTRFGLQYPWPKYAQVVVRDFVSGAMENTTATIHYEPVQHDSREHLDDRQETIIAHELSHHWFGDYVTSESWSNLPLNESFASYSEYIWLEHRRGKDEADRHLKEQLEQYLSEAENKREPLIRYQYADKEDMFDRHSYQKGSRVLHLLRRTVGDEAFFAGLKHYLEKNSLTSVEISELRTAMEDVTGQDLIPFFDQWFMQRGHPELEVAYEYNAAQKQLAVKVAQKQPTKFSPLYSFTTTVEVATAASKQQYPIRISTADTTFVLPVSAEPMNVVFDNEYILPARISERKPLEWWGTQLASGSNYPQKAYAIDYLGIAVENDTARAPLIAALKDKHWGIRLAALQALESYPARSSFADALSMLGQNDPEAQVRAKATDLLAELAEALRNQGGQSGSVSMETLLPVFEHALLDSSYRTVAAGLRGLYAANKGKGLEAAKRNMHLKSPDVRGTIAEMLLAERTPDGTAYAIRAARELPNTLKRFQLVQVLGPFLAQQSDVTLQAAGIEVLMNLAKQNPVWEIRLVAARSLKFFRFKPDVDAFLIKLKQEEKNAELKRFYEREL